MPFPASISRQPTAELGFAAKMVDDCLNEAVNIRASDLHLQPRSDSWEVFYRIDGVLHLAKTFPVDRDTDPVARLMALANLPSYMGGVPQEGTFTWKSIDGSIREMRLSTFSTVHGRRAAIRISSHAGTVRTLEQLGVSEETSLALGRVCEGKDGWCLVAGPAGSGKTTTLYACLASIAASKNRRSVLTIEDPVESIIDSISQSQLQPNSGLTLAAAMRSAVRQDAEVLLVTEIRDTETAEAVLAASMTGHLCFSSIHSASVGSTLRRLVQMNLPTFAIQSGLRAVLCQRLLRCLCKKCESHNQSSQECSQCHGTGYQGRLPVMQLVEFDGADFSHQLFEKLEQGATADQLDRFIESKGFASLKSQATQLVQSGVTDEAEVFRVFGGRRSA